MKYVVSVEWPSGHKVREVWAHEAEAMARWFHYVRNDQPELPKLGTLTAGNAVLARIKTSGGATASMEVPRVTA